MAEDDDSANYFPGLNKRHGFFKAIERNQRDRDHYHQEWAERRESRQDGVKKDWRQTKRRPPKALYCPPHTRGRERRSTIGGLYQLEIEIVPDHWHKQTIKVGQCEKIASELGDQYQLTQLERQTLKKMLAEFEQSLGV